MEAKEIVRIIDISKTRIIVCILLVTLTAPLRANYDSQIKAPAQVTLIELLNHDLNGGTGHLNRNHYFANLTTKENTTLGGLNFGWDTDPIIIINKFLITETNISEKEAKIVVAFDVIGRSTGEGNTKDATHRRQLLPSPQKTQLVNYSMRSIDGKWLITSRALPAVSKCALIRLYQDDIKLSNLNIEKLKNKKSLSPAAISNLTESLDYTRGQLKILENMEGRCN